MAGTLVLVVGPSGSGKDTLIDGAVAALGPEAPLRVARRVITRPVTAGGEVHEAVTEAAFLARARAGAFALSWAAHGLHYGIPADIADDLARGVCVLANVSRTVLADAAARFPVAVVEVTAPPAVLAARLMARGREDGPDVTRRLSRAVAVALPMAAQVVMNDASVAEGVARMLAALRVATGGVLGGAATGGRPMGLG